MVLDVELTLNRFGLGRPAPNKLQLGFVRIALWRGLQKLAVSFEVNWRLREDGPAYWPRTPPFVVPAHGPAARPGAN